ncbi:adenylosuccinate lyase [Candidatus Woesearchaeota archaeon]|nr:adenylosuccinate lyase [Candidatus Woesearchaeota archaeon]
MVNNNILSERYTTKEINSIFSKEGKILAERNLWIAVMKAQKELGLNIPEEDIQKYEKAKENINLKLIEEIEKKTKHDVKARIEAFVKEADAGEHIHKGLTSRDLTDNVEQMQIMNASKIVFNKYVAVLNNFVQKSEDYCDIVLTARTHHKPAQCTLLGRRFSMWVEELMGHLKDFENFIDEYPLRGIKGPVGTQFDMLKLLGTKEKVDLLEKKIADQLGFKNVSSSPGQVYPRSLDLMLVSKLIGLSSSCENFAKTMRLMAGYDLVNEGFSEGQTGSSAMPHKINTKNCERICGLSSLLKMYSDGISRVSGDQWEEGDVSCSVVRRVVIPDSFYTSDGVCETTLNVLTNMGVYKNTINEEVSRYLPFLATTEILMLAIEAGIGREKAHEIIKKYSIKAINEKSDFIKELAKDETFKQVGLNEEKINELLNDKVHFTGNASEQILQVEQKAQYFLEKYKTATSYKGKEIV